MISSLSPDTATQWLASNALPARVRYYSPGSTLLGYANADHWGIAQSTDLARDLLVARLDPDPFPIDHLFRSIVHRCRRPCGTAMNRAIWTTGPGAFGRSRAQARQEQG